MNDAENAFKESLHELEENAKACDREEARKIVNWIAEKNRPKMMLTGVVPFVSINGVYNLAQLEAILVFVREEQENFYKAKADAR